MSKQYDATIVGQQAQALGGVHTSAALANNYANTGGGSGVPAGSTAYTSDLGAAMFNGTNWVSVSGLGSTLNVKNYGAFGDGTARALSTTYSTLAAAQALYPSAASLNEEIDYNAIRRAIEVAVAAGGGTVNIPKGTYIMNNANHQGNIQLPSCSISGSGTQLNIKGEGIWNTQLKWPTDSGTTGSLYAMSCGPQASSFATPLTGGRYSNTQFFGFLEDFSLIGPSQSISRGTVNANLSGLAWGARRFMNRVRIAGFYAGLDIVGDWTSFINVILENCFYDAYFPYKSTSLYGDLLFVKCMFGNAARADVCIGTRGYMGAKFDGCFIGSAPYAFLNEAGTQGTTADGSTHVGSTQFEKCLFENLGNAFIGDDNAQAATGGAGTRNFRWEGVTMFDCYWSWNSGNKDTTQSRDADYAIIANSIKRFVVTEFTNFIPPDVGLFRVDIVNGFELYADLTALITALNGGTKQFADPAISMNSPTTIRFKDSPTSTRGSVWRASSSNLNIYDLLEFNANRAVASTNSTIPIVGTAMHGTNVANGYVLVSQGGHRPQVNSVETPPSANQWIKKSSTAAKAIAATGPTDGQVLGYASSVDTVNNRYTFLWSGGAVIGD